MFLTSPHSCFSLLPDSKPQIFPLDSFLFKENAKRIFGQSKFFHQLNSLSENLKRGSRFLLRRHDGKLAFFDAVFSKKKKNRWLIQGIDLKKDLRKYNLFMALLNHKEIGLKATGTGTTVSANPVAKLRYYINCVLGLIDIDKEGVLGKISNYNSTEGLSNGEFEAILGIALALKPNKFEDVCIFIQPKLCPDGGNQFYEISQVTNTLAVGQGIMIEGENRKVKNIMACTKEWLQKNYYYPLIQIYAILDKMEEQAKKRLKQLEKQQQEKKRELTQALKLHEQYQRRREKEKEVDCCSLM